MQKIKDKKEKHTWSCQIMDELLKSASMHKYDKTGMKPLPSIYSKDEEARPNSHEPLSDTNENKNKKDGNKEITASETSSLGKKQEENKKGGIPSFTIFIITTLTNCLIC